MKKKPPLVAKIKGYDWTFYAEKPMTYKRKHGDDSNAITYPVHNEVYFNINNLAPEYVRHEVFHAFIASTSTKSSNLDKEQMEELCAELYGDHGPEMDLLVDKIISYFLR